MSRKQREYSDSVVLANRRYRRKWKWLTSVLSVFVVIGTVSSLMLPAITMNRYTCGQEEHTHGADCYIVGTERELTCTAETLQLHVHTPACFGAESEPICNQVDFVVHKHDAACYDADGILVCTLEEIEEHVHKDACYETIQTVIDPGHAHAEVCYTWTVNEVPTCGIEESESHRHGDGCYVPETKLTCTEAECEGHTHGEGCYGQDGSLSCTLEESAGHIHGTSCYTEVAVLTCDLAESDGHQHGESCYDLVQGELLCTEEEREPVIEISEPELICEKPVVILHTHVATCYEYDKDGNVVALICTEPEVFAHQHTDACFTERQTTTLICTVPEHTHTDGCRESGLTAEAQAQVDTVVLAIDALPAIEEVNVQLTAFEEAGDTAGRDAYIAALTEQTSPVFAQYDQLTEGQKAAVTNAAKLMALKWLLLEEEPPVLTEEEQAQLDAVIAQIEALSEAEAFSAKLAAFEEARNLTDWTAAVEEAREKTQVARNFYVTLPEPLQSSVTNIQKLTDLEALLAEVKAPSLTEEEKTAVEALIAQIDALPTLEELTLQPATLEEGQDNTGLLDLIQQVGSVREAYNGLNPVQQAAVTNEEKLVELEEFLATQSIGPTVAELQEAVAIYNEIESLPTIEQTQAQFDSLAVEPESLAAYQAKLVSQVKGLMARYEVLHEEAKANVSNIQVLIDFIIWLEEIGLIEPAPDFEVSAGNVSASVRVEGAELPEGAQFVLNADAYSQEEMDSLIKLLNTHMFQMEKGVLNYVVMDMHFADAEGTEISFTGNAEVTLTFVEPILPGVKGPQVFHISGETVENVGQEIVQTEAGITSVTLKTNGFSPVVIADAGGHIEEILADDHAYIYDAVMKADANTDSKQAISTGTASWDSDNNAGNDKSATNSILRTFDVATYTLSYKTGLRQQAIDNGVSGYRTGTVYFEFILPLSEQQGQFETDSMGWLATYSEVKYEIVKEANRQILRGSFLAEPVSGNPSAIGNSINEMNVAIRALKMKQGSTITPTFTLWLEGNQVDAGVENGIPTKIVTGTTGTCDTHGEPEFKTITPATITISAVQRLNLAMVKGEASFTSLIDDFAFGTGNALALNKNAGNLNGRIFVYGLTLQVVGKDATSGLKGIQFPDDGSTITFDITMTSQYKDYNQKQTNLDSTDYRCLVWSGAPNLRNVEQQDGRTITAAENFAATAAPFNTGAPNGLKGSCFNGGTWSFTQDASNKQLYHVTVTDFVIDISSIKNFPSCTGNFSEENAKHQYYNPDNVTNAWDIQNACFSAGELWVVQPLVAKNKTIESVYGNGTLNYEIRDTNFKVNNQAVTQTVTTDDHNSYGFGLQLPGTVESDIYFTSYGRGWEQPLTPGEFMGGYDYATPGQPMTIYHLISNDNAEGDNRGCAMELFTKFDENFFDPDGTYSVKIFSPSAEADANGVKKWWSGEAPEIKVLWVSRVYGKGWNNQGLKPDKSNSLGTGNNVTGDNYDWDMISAYSDGMSNGEQFEYFESLEALESAGEQCIGVLVEARGIVAQGMNHVELQINGKVREDCAPGYVYMAVTHARLWRIKDMAWAARYYKGLQGSDAASEANWAAHRLEYIDEYVRKGMPSHLTVKNFKDVKTGHGNDTLFSTIYWDKRVGGSTGGKNHSEGLTNMQKIWYKADGTSGGDYNRFWMDSCLVVGHTVSIEKSTAQTTTDSGGKVSNKTVYSLDLGQRYVDYKLTPTIKRSIGSGTAGDGNVTKTTITIKDYLPAELEYIAGSAYWGGIYTQDPKCARAGTVTGGTKLDPVVTKNADGSTTLTWTLKDVTLEKLATMELPPIYYSTRLTGVLVDQQGIKNTATIRSTGDYQRELKETFNNKAVFGITIQKSEGASIVKLADQDKVEIDAPIGFTMFVGNNSANDMKNQIIVDDLPWIGDGRGTSFDGTMKVTEFSVNSELTSSLTFYYTTNTALRGKKSTDYTNGSFTTANSWTKVTPGAAVNGMSPLSIPQNTVQVVAVGTLPAGKTLQMHTTIELPGSAGGNMLVNQLTMNTLNSQAASTVVSRSLSGLTWLDANHNGIQDNTETVQSGVKVTLMKLENGAYKDLVSIQTGQKYDVARGTAAEAYDQGKYLFYNLMPGTYAVRFEKGDFDITYYHASPVDAGQNLDQYDQIDSDGIPEWGINQELLKTEIQGIHMPTIEAMGQSNTYHSPYHDSGFYAWGAVLPDTGGAGTFLYTFSGWATITIAFALMYSTKHKRRRGAM